jgi:hypothetical protein
LADTLFFGISLKIVGEKYRKDEDSCLSLLIGAGCVVAERLT